MTQQEAVQNCAEISFGNPFKALLQSIDVEQLANDCFADDGQSPNSSWSNLISINRDYKKLSDTYQDVKKMARTYITESGPKSSLESKLNRYMT